MGEVAAVTAGMLGSGALGFLSSQEAQKAQAEAQRQQMLYALQAQEAMRREIGPSLALGESATTKAATAAEGGYLEAERNLARQTGEGEKALAAQEAKGQGQVQQAITNAGLGGTTMAANAVRGLNADHARMMSDFQTKMAGLKASLAGQHAAQKAQSLGQIAQFQAYKAGALGGTFGAMNAQASQPMNFSYNPPNFSGIGQLLPWMFAGNGDKTGGWVGSADAYAGGF